MADTTPFSTILSYLSPDDQTALAHGDLEQVTHIIYNLSEKRPELGINPDAAITQAIDYFKDAVPNQTPTQEQEERRNNPSLLDAAEGIAGFATLGIRESKEDDIARNFAELYKNNLKQELAAIEALPATTDAEKKSKQDKLQALLVKTKASGISDARVNDLASRLGETNDTKTRASERIRRRYAQYQRDNAAKKPTDEAFGKYTDRLSSRMLSDMTVSEREDFLMKMADHQLTRTHNEFTDLFREKKGLFGIRRRTIGVGKQRSIARNQTKEIKTARRQEEQLATQKGQRPGIRRRGAIIFRTITSTFFPDAFEPSGEDWARNEYRNEYSSQQRSQGAGFDAYGTYSRFQQGRSFFNLIRGLGGAGGGGAAAGGGEATAAAAGTSEFWGPVLAAILIFIVILLLLVGLFVVLFGSTSPVNIDIEQETCGDFSQFIDATDFTDKFADLQWQHFHIRNPGGQYRTTDGSNPNPHFQDAITAYKLLFNTYCLFYGHADGKLTGENNFNTFAKLLLGDRFVQKNGKWIYIDDLQNTGTGHEKAKFITNFVAFDDTLPGCTAQFQPAAGGNDITTIFINLNKCSVQEDQFLIGQSLAHTLLVQQEDAIGKHDILDLFKGKVIGTKGITSLDGFLPTFGCDVKNGNDLVYGSEDGTIHKDLNIGELQPDQQQRNCFADMVGEYLSYPYYTNTSRILAGFVANTPTPGAANTSPTPIPTKGNAPSIGPNVLADFPNSQYADYYNFARDNLFDGESFFTSLKAATCPDTLSITGDSAALTDGLKKYGFLVTGDITKDKLSQTYETVCMLMQSNRYKTLMKADTAPVTINFNQAHGCCGFTSGDTVNIWGWGDPDFNRFTLAHELTHELVHDNRSPNIYSLYYQNVFIRAPALPSFNCQHDYDNNWCTVDGDVCDEKSPICKVKCRGPYEGECIADAAGLYLVYPRFNDIFSGLDARKPMSDYPTGKYSKYYDFVNNEIFGGVVFNGGNPTTTAEFSSSVVDRFKANPSCLHDSIGRGWAYLIKDDINCVDTVVPALPATTSKDGQSATSELKRSVTNFGILECVGFVKAVAAGIGKPFDVFGDAASYFHNPPTGYQPIPRGGNTTNIQAGDVVVYEYPGGQHIADVSKVVATYTSDTDGKVYTKFQVAEGNGGYCGLPDGNRAPGCIDKAYETTENGDISGWIRPL